LFMCKIFYEIMVINSFLIKTQKEYQNALSPELKV
jgi:hypothetical protein